MNAAIFYLTLLVICYLSSPAVANPATTSRLKLDAANAYHAGKYQQARSIWKSLLQQPELKPAHLAEIYSLLAALSQQLGQPRKAVSFWQQAIAIYRSPSNTGQTKSPYLLATVLVEKAQAHNSLHQTAFSRTLLREAINIAQQEDYTLIEATAYQALGNAQTIARDYSDAIFNYDQSLAAAQKINNSQLIVVALNNLSNSYQKKSQLLKNQAQSAQESGDKSAPDLFRTASAMAQLAWHYAREAVKKSESSQSLFSAIAILQLVELAKTYSMHQEVELISVEDYLRRTHQILLSIPNSQRKASALIKLAHLQENPVGVLKSAIQVSQSIGDLPTQSLALGELGAYYEQKQEYDKALQLTHQARQIAGQINAANILYRWDWQAGRIHRSLGHREDAILAYQQAIASKQLIRSELARSNQDLTIDFRLEVEPVYRQLIELLLTGNPKQSAQRQALLVKDLLRVSELGHFFGDDCLLPKAERENPHSPHSTLTTVINTIILEKNTYIILQLPDGQVKSLALPITAARMNQMVKQWRYDLENQENDRYLSLSRKLYQLLIKPIEPELAASETEQLVFVNDGILRNVPLAALQDGKQFLIEKYPISNSLGFDLKLESAESSLIHVLAFGLTRGGEESPPLAHVKEELTNLGKITETNSFLDREFNLDNFVRETLQDKYNVIHIATHPQFSGIAGHTYLEAYKTKITLTELEQILSQRARDSPLELLTLSACETAVGSSRAILGLAGVALRSNVEHVIGSLWSVYGREMASFTSDFYRYWLQDKLTLSEALRQAQLNLINQPDFHPAIWSSLILIER